MKTNQPTQPTTAATLIYSGLLAIHLIFSWLGLITALSLAALNDPAWWHFLPTAAIAAALWPIIKRMHDQYWGKPKP